MLNNLVYFIERIATALYIFIALAALLQWRRWSGQRWAYRATQFELEREFARYRSGNSLTALLLLFEVALIIAGIQFAVAPTLRQFQQNNGEPVAAVVDIDFRTPTPPPPATVVFNADIEVFQNINPADQIFFTATPVPTAVGTLVRNAPEASGCDQEGARLTFPVNGLKVFSIVEVTGQAYTDDFSSYKLELRGPGTFNNFVTLEGSGSALQEEGALGQFNPSLYEPGLYQFRLVVFDITDTMKAACTVNIYLEDPLPTPTRAAQP
jgi:hypothetical protein